LEQLTDGGWVVEGDHREGRPVDGRHSHVREHHGLEETDAAAGSEPEEGSGLGGGVQLVLGGDGGQVEVNKVVVVAQADEVEEQLLLRDLLDGCVVGAVRALQRPRPERAAAG
jgi:hypothetical protein